MPSGDGRRFTGGEARGTRQEENERTNARTHARRTHGARRSRSERLAQPKVFGAASCAGHAIHRTRGSTPLGGGGTSDLDTSRGPPIQTPNAKNSYNAGTFTLSNLFLAIPQRSTIPTGFPFFLHILRPSLAQNFHRRQILETKIFPFQKFANQILQKLETPVRDGKRKNQLGGGN